jgi:hypothetical protein
VEQASRCLQHDLDQCTTLAQNTSLITLGHDFKLDRADIGRLTGRTECLKTLDTDLLGLVHGSLQELARIELMKVFFMVRLMAAVMARRMSVSMFTLRTPWRMPSRISATGTP